MSLLRPATTEEPTSSTQPSFVRFNRDLEEVVRDCIQTLSRLPEHDPSLVAKVEAARQKAVEPARALADAIQATSWSGDLSPSPHQVGEHQRHRQKVLGNLSRADGRARVELHQAEIVEAEDYWRRWERDDLRPQAQRAGYRLIALLATAGRDPEAHDPLAAPLGVALGKYAAALDEAREQPRRARRSLAAAREAAEKSDERYQPPVGQPSRVWAVSPSELARQNPPRRLGGWTTVRT